MSEDKEHSPLQIGDKITFKAACRYSYEKVTRIVNGFYNGLPTVRYQGYAQFVVKPHEILAVAELEGKQ